MRIQGNWLRVLFCLNSFFFVFSVLSPWAYKTTPLMFERPPWPLSSGEELYWSFQVVFYPYRSGYQNRLISWDFWFGPHDRVVLSDFWFSQQMYYYGFTYEWIRIFAFQMLTVCSAIFVLATKWQKTKLMLVPSTFSILCVLLGLLLVARFTFVWKGYSNPAWGLAVAVFSALGFVALFLVRYGLERRSSVSAGSRLNSRLQQSP